MKYVICPICNQEINAKRKIDYVLSNHLKRVHSITDPEKLFDILWKVKLARI